MTTSTASRVDYATETVINSQQEKLFRLYLRARSGRGVIDPHEATANEDGSVSLYFTGEDGALEVLSDVPEAIVRAAHETSPTRTTVMLINLSDEGMMIDGQKLYVDPALTQPQPPSRDRQRSG